MLTALKVIANTQSWNTSDTGNYIVVWIFMLGLGWALMAGIAYAVEKSLPHKSARILIGVLALVILVIQLALIVAMGLPSILTTGAPAFSIGMLYITYSHLFGPAHHRAAHNADVLHTIQLRSVEKPYWKVDQLEQQARTALQQYCQSWDTGTSPDFASYMTPQLAEFNQKFWESLRRMGRSLQIERSIKKITMTETSPDGEPGEWFIATLEVNSADKSAANNQRPLPVYLGLNNPVYFTTMHLKFVRQNDQWLLASNELDHTVFNLPNKTITNTPAREVVSNFASQHNGLFAPTVESWIMPPNGHVFPEGPFEIEQAANCVFFPESNGSLINFFDVQTNNNSGRHKKDTDRQSESYFVGQLILPRNYDRITVMPRSFASRFTNFIEPSTISTEWTDFNDKFVIYAADTDVVSSLELLNPRLMADMYDFCPYITVDITDNVALFYVPIVNSSNAGKSPAKTYTHDGTIEGHLFELLQQASKELQR